MIVVTLELWPHGDKDQARHLGTATIANVIGGTAKEGNYEFVVVDHHADMSLVGVPEGSKFMLSKWGKPGEKWKAGKVMQFPRQRLGAWDLLYRVLKSAVGTRNF